ncbi:GNAT family N-acetyltransferase [Flavimaricola marinus]|uniref:Acetyltransferase (GNAT) family protein n=1 Tax=Flavimaricola marinus TaxID=1819565 RepID=A0A238LF79_9RHOB|nr:GNAT family N-acetyltransferase [Flavimaricola marinus]SMY08367.1 Acetyltransferase (GNAT) family protein [Flavimaricola marinus]
MTALRRLCPDDPALAEVLALIRAEYAFMDGVVDPPSTMHDLTLEGLAETAGKAEIWVAGVPVMACAILTPKPPVLYLGKLAVAASERRRGWARRLVDLACDRAGALGFEAVELGTRVELTANQAAFEAMGFTEVAREAHPGFDRPTAIVYQRRIA